MATIEDLITAYVTQRQRAFHGGSRGIATPEQRRAWEAEARQAVADVRAEALREFARGIAPDDHHCFRPQGCVDCGRQKARKAFRDALNRQADLIERG